ncbi:MAG: hypothetical protein IPM59_01910 [Chloracidobacterium sp.]|nr:hypothetical protein [Chloracidobacterium sp.]
MTVTLLLLFGCSGDRRIQGSVFVVTNGAENVKLGLVKITIIPEDVATKFASEKKDAVTSALSVLREQADALRPELEQAQADFDASKKSYELVSSQRDSAKSKVNALDAQFNPYALETYSFLSEYDTPEQIAERARQARLGKQLNSLRRQLVAIESRLAQAGTERTNKETELNAVKGRLAVIFAKMTSIAAPAVLLDGVPEGIAKVVTDAEGKFELKLPSGRYALFASAQRRIVTSTEEYHWMIWVNVASEAPTLILSNQNLLGEDSEDSVFKLKELLPKDAQPASSPESVKL